MEEAEEQVFEKVDLLIYEIKKTYFEGLAKGENVKFNRRICKKTGDFIVTGSLHFEIEHESE